MELGTKAKVAAFIVANGLFLMLATQLAYNVGWDEGAAYGSGKVGSVINRDGSVTVTNNGKPVFRFLSDAEVMAKQQRQNAEDALASDKQPRR